MINLVGKENTNLTFHYFTFYYNHTTFQAIVLPTSLLKRDHGLKFEIKEGQNGWIPCLDDTNQMYALMRIDTLITVVQKT
ncbi:MAG: hypothetical protein AAF770_01200 [Bacteroidota bacterium]